MSVDDCNQRVVYNSVNITRMHSCKNTQVSASQTHQQARQSKSATREVATTRFSYLHDLDSNHHRASPSPLVHRAESPHSEDFPRGDVGLINHPREIRRWLYFRLRTRCLPDVVSSHRIFHLVAIKCIVEMYIASEHRPVSTELADSAHQFPPRPNHVKHIGTT